MVANVVGIDARTSIEQQAAKWLIRMDGDEPLTDLEKEALREWMGRSPLHRRELTRLARFWKEANILTELVGAIESEVRVRKRRRRIARIRTILVAAGAVLTLCHSDLLRSAALGGPVMSTPVPRLGWCMTAARADEHAIRLESEPER